MYPEALVGDVKEVIDKVIGMHLVVQDGDYLIVR